MRYRALASGEAPEARDAFNAALATTSRALSAARPHAPPPQQQTTDREIRDQERRGNKHSGITHLSTIAHWRTLPRRQDATCGKWQRLTARIRKTQSGGSSYVCSVYKRTWEALMADKKLIGYARVSTSQQGRSGLGLEAQKKALERFAQAESLTLGRIFVEVETGKGSASTRTKRTLLF
jgi:hypothetical protein